MNDNASQQDHPIVEAGDRDGNGLRVSFHWHRDRFAHDVEIVHDRQTTKILSSLEGTDQEEWPSSPVFQQLSFERDSDNRPVALLVGMAGKSHWSACIEPVGEQGVIRFDVACRCQLAPQLLGSAYQLASQVESAGEQFCRLTAHDQNARLSLIRLDQAPSACLRMDDRTLSIQLNELPASCPVTVRWQYTIGLPLQ